MRTQTYILDADGNPAPEPDITKWGEWYGGLESSRAVSRTTIGDVLVSTVFLGTDHRFGDEGPPILWETMVFGGPLADEIERHSSREAAVAGHEDMVKRVREAMLGAEWVAAYNAELKARS